MTSSHKCWAREQLSIVQLIGVLGFWGFGVLGFWGSCARPAASRIFDGALDDARRHVQVAGDLLPTEPVTVQYRHVALASREAIEDRERKSIHLVALLAFDMARVRPEARAWDRRSRSRRRTDRRGIRACDDREGRRRSSRSSGAATYRPRPSSVRCTGGRPPSRHASWNASSTSSSVAPGLARRIWRRSFSARRPPTSSASSACVLCDPGGHPIVVVMHPDRGVQPDNWPPLFWSRSDRWPRTRCWAR